MRVIDRFVEKQFVAKYNQETKNDLPEALDYDFPKITDESRRTGGSCIRGSAKFGGNLRDAMDINNVGKGRKQAHKTDLGRKSMLDMDRKTSKNHNADSDFMTAANRAQRQRQGSVNVKNQPGSSQQKRETPRF